MSDDNVDKTDLNKKDINHLEEKIDNVCSEIERLDANTPNKDDFQDLKSTIDSVVLQGNGSEPLTVKTNENRTNLKNLRRHINALWAFVGTLVGLVGSFLIRAFTKFL